MKNKSTKHALLASVLSIVMCFAMLIGSTFAWFTDEVKSGMNKIVAGNLDVELEYSLDGTTWTAVNETTNMFKEDALWEPGYTEVVYLRVSNVGSLALKYQFGINVADKVIGKTADDKDIDLSDFVEFGIVETEAIFADRAAARAAVDGNTALISAGYSSAEGHLIAGEKSNILALVVYMPETVDNAANYAGDNQPSINLGINLVATQDAVENDSFGNDYDANGVSYPFGVTEESFAVGDVAVAADGKTFYNDANDAIQAGGTIYFKENSNITNLKTHLNITKDITIYANGADFGGKDISIGTYAAPDNKETTVNIYNAKNLVVWGQPVVGREDIWNVNFYDCVNDGRNFLMYRGGDTATSKINLTMSNCTATGYTDSIVHTSADGTINITNCVFNNNCAPVNIAHKQSGNMTITVENCVFNGCGKIDESNDYFAPARFVNNSSIGSLNVVLKNNTFTDTIGTNGDILLVDHRAGKENYALTAEITTTNPVMVRSSSEAAYSYAGGTITLPN